MENEHQIPIWFFIGGVLAVYGVLILGAGLYALAWPPEHPVKLANLHADIWWGVLLTIVGTFYFLKYRPRKGQPVTGEEE